MSTGMGIEQVRAEFDIPRLQAFNKYAEKFPPSHVLIAAYFGFGKESKPKEQEADFSELMAAFPEVRR